MRADKKQLLPSIGLRFKYGLNWPKAVAKLLRENTVIMVLHGPGRSKAQRARSPYEGYAALKLSRNNGAWRASGSMMRNTKPLTFPTCTGGVGCVVGWSIIDEDGRVLLSERLDAVLSVTIGITPSFGKGQLELNFKEFS